MRDEASRDRAEKNTKYRFRNVKYILAVLALALNTVIKFGPSLASFTGYVEGDYRAEVSAKPQTEMIRKTNQISMDWVGSPPTNSSFESASHGPTGSIRSSSYNPSSSAVKNEPRIRSNVLQASEHPPCTSCLFLFWTGYPTLPTMYEVTLRSAVKIYGRENIVIISTALQDLEWYPTIWNISGYDLAFRLTEFHNMTIWKEFIDSLGSEAHYSDFVRIALIHLYGGVYADFDSLWIRPVPLHYPVPAGSKWEGKTLLRVHADERIKHRGRRVPSDGISNGVLGGIKNSTYYRQVLEWMPINYDPNIWTGIGGNLLLRSFDICNCSAEFVTIKYLDMYGIFGAHAPKFMTTPITTKEDEKWLHHVINESYQLHMFGSKTATAKGAQPVNGSLYTIVFDRLGFSLDNASMA